MTITAKRELTAQSKANAWDIILGLVGECGEGVSDCEREAISLAELWLIDPEKIPGMFADARKFRETTKEAEEAKAAEPQAEVKPQVVEEVKPKSLRRSIGKSDLFIWQKPQPAQEKVEATTEAKAEEEGKTDTITKTAETAEAAVADAAAKLVADFKFHPSDLAEPKAAPPTIEEKNRALEELADLKGKDPITYAGKRKELAAELCTTVAAIDQAVKIVLERRADDSEQSQATKIVAIGVGKNVVLWHSPNNEGYASVAVKGHRENYSIESTAFEDWLLYEYGRVYQAKVNGEMTPQTPGSGALRDAIAQLKGIARRKEEYRPAIRVGGDYETIWIDLGGPDWRAVKVTAKGWKVWPGGDAAFVRSGSMLALPEPVRGGSIELLKKIINVRPEEFVLVPAWQLQALNPSGPYPIMNVHGETGDGKTWTCNAIVMTVNPNSTPLRTPEKIEDLFIAARNNWTVGFDNLSWLSAAWADRLCSLSTGIAAGKRAHYTNDEEHAFALKCPTLFNGIPVDLAQRSDLARRTIRLGVSPIKTRRTEYELKEEFKEIWPQVFGALLDGLVGALRDWRGISVKDPATLMDFEKFAEAGCRAMGFKELEFVKAYELNREGSMIVSVDADPVGRTIRAFINKKPDGFEGQMSVLYDTLAKYKPINLGPHDWPKSPTKLSTSLRRLAKPLAAVSIECSTDVDRRGEKPPGTQHDVIIRRV